MDSRHLTSQDIVVLDLRSVEVLHDYKHLKVKLGNDLQEQVCAAITKYLEKISVILIFIAFSSSRVHLR